MNNQRLPLIVWLTMMVISLAGSGTAQDLQASLAAFDQGTALIESGRYTEALGSFEDALAGGFGNAALHYNRGIAYYRLDQLGHAIASFERARRLNPSDRTVIHNLSIARLRIQDRMSKLPDPIGASFWSWLSLGLGSMGLFLVGTLAYLAWTTLMVLSIRRTSRSDWRRRGLWLAGVVAALGIGLGLATSLRPADGPAAVVIADEIGVFPSALATDAADLQIHEGLTVSVLGRAGDWTAIRLPNGVTGWVNSASILDI